MHLSSGQELALPASLPLPLVDRAADILGAPLIAVDALCGGYTPQRLYRLHLADGRSAVLKAASPSERAGPGPPWIEVLRGEVRAYRDQPALRRWQPAFLGAFEHEGWVGLLIEDLTSAVRVPPWTDAALDTVARDLAAMHEATLGTEPPVGVRLPRDPRFFDRIHRRGPILGRLPTSWDVPDWWDWVQRARPRAEFALDACYMSAADPRCVVHFDVRSDNIFLRDGRMLLIDWSDPHWFSPAVDSVYWALGVQVEDGREASQVHGRYLAHALDLTDTAVLGGLAWCVGYFLDRLQDGRGPTRVLALQMRFLQPALAWFARAACLPNPPDITPNGRPSAPAPSVS